MKKIICKHRFYYKDQKTFPARYQCKYCGEIRKEKVFKKSWTTLMGIGIEKTRKDGSINKKYLEPN